MKTYGDLNAVVGTVSFDSEALVARVLAQGRRDVRRRRVAVAAGAVAIGAVALTSNALSWSSGPSARQALDPADPSAQVELPTPELTDVRLVARLPVPGEPVSATYKNGDVRVIRSLDPDASGTGSVTVDLGVDMPLAADDISRADAKCAALAADSRGDTCQRLADGWMFLSTSRDSAQAAANALDWSATVLNKDGSRVAVHATNYLAATSPTRSSPVLDLHEIEALADDPVWFQPPS